MLFERRAHTGQPTTRYLRLPSTQTVRTGSATPHRLQPQILSTIEVLSARVPRAIKSRINLKSGVLRPCRSRAGSPPQLPNGNRTCRVTNRRGESLPGAGGKQPRRTKPRPLVRGGVPGVGASEIMATGCGQSTHPSLVSIASRSPHQRNSGAAAEQHRCAYKTSVGSIAAEGQPWQRNPAVRFPPLDLDHPATSAATANPSPRTALPSIRIRYVHNGAAKVVVLRLKPTPEATSRRY